MSQLTIFENELSKSPEKQLEQINLALQKISTWGNNVNMSTIKNVTDDIATSTTSTKYAGLQGYNTSFRNVNPLVRIDVSLCLNANGNVAEVIILLDGQEVKKSKTSINGIQMHNFFFQGTTNVGNHNLELQWKTSAGTINKVEGGSQLLVTNFL